MSEDASSTTVVTKITADKDSKVQPAMSFTAVTSHKEMADAFVREILRLAQRIIPDHELSIEDLMAICHMALDRREAGIVMMEGRHLRGRVAEQISRADRYDEPFSLMVLRLEELPDKAAYESVVETLCERMRKTDLMFMFKHRIVLILPHTPRKPRRMLEERIKCLLEAAFNEVRNMDIHGLTYPDPSLKNKSSVLDWVEDHLRS
jgi:hypothetical protein